MERIITTLIGKRDSGGILIDWLTARFTYCDVETWSRFLAENRISINNRSAKRDSVLTIGDRVSFSPPPIVEPPVPSSYATAYEDDDFLVIDKPPLLPCHPGGIFFKHTLWYLLKEKHETVRMISRLDRETSGLMLVCKNEHGERHARAMQKDGMIRKRYIVAVHGTVKGDFIAKGFLIPDTGSIVRKKRAFVFSETLETPENGESCETRFEVIESSGSLTLLRAELVSGRTHQIRSTLRSLGYPVLGDKLYGLDDTLFLRYSGGTLSDKDRETLVLPHQALHSATLEFPNREGKSIAAAVPPPWDFPPEFLKESFQT